VSRVATADERFMALALKWARRARRRTWPNPMVGAVLVKGGRVLAAGYHRRAGRPHAEAEAIEQAGGRARGASLYVTLEPCHRTGRTGPCTDLIRSAGIRKVFVGTRDPNPDESGRGLAVLRRSGIPVVAGVLEGACRSLNEVYNVFIRERRSFVLLKVASSLDGRMAASGGDSRWISGEASRRHAHRLRARSDAVLVGAGTVLKDNPSLDVRHVPGRNPAVVVLDSDLRISPRSRLLRLKRGAPIWIYSKKSPPSRRAAGLRSAGAEIVEVPARGELLDLRVVCRDLYKRGVYQLLVEGGAAVIGSLLRSRLVDRMEVHLAPRLLGAGGVPLGDWQGPGKVAVAPRLLDVRWRRRGEDMSCSGLVWWPGGKA
jgi:diaminohydroxyphosphoribosylaminopyrimidine deaminase/5-amino-6-(5-phosphoribosylamino)uracil reductase